MSWLRRSLFGVLVTLVAASLARAQEAPPAAASAAPAPAKATKAMPAPPPLEVLPEQEVEGKAQVPTVDVIMLPTKTSPALAPPARKKDLKDAGSWHLPDEAPPPRPSSEE